MHPLTDVTLVEGIILGSPVWLPLAWWALMHAAVAFVEGDWLGALEELTEWVRR